MGRSRCKCGRTRARVRVATPQETLWAEVVAGNVNRLKNLKRQMYGRANFDLLRTRVLYAA
jgi:transposase